MKDSYGGKQYNYDKKKEEELRKSIKVGQLVSVIRFDPKKMTADVQPLSQERINGEYANKTPILGVPCVPFSFGRYIIRPWYEKGDYGYIGHIDHDIDYVLSKGQITQPNTTRNHADEDCVFFGGLKVDTNTLPDGIPDNSLVICTKDGSQYVSYQDKRMEIVWETIDITGDINIVGDVTLQGDYTQIGDMGITGNLLVAGRASVGGDAVIGGKSFLDHTHPTPAGGSGPPN